MMLASCAHSTSDAPETPSRSSLYCAQPESRQLNCGMTAPRAQAATDATRSPPSLFTARFYRIGTFASARRPPDPPRCGRCGPPAAYTVYTCLSAFLASGLGIEDASVGIVQMMNKLNKPSAALK
jgi:hypothetical protein